MPAPLIVITPVHFHAFHFADFRHCRRCAIIDAAIFRADYFSIAAVCLSPLSAADADAFRLIIIYATFQPLRQIAPAMPPDYFDASQLRLFAAARRRAAITFFTRRQPFAIDAGCCHADTPLRRYFISH
jgi:hypothetical protein